jgi:hypothetical protein
VSDLEFLRKSYKTSDCTLAVESLKQLTTVPMYNDRTYEQMAASEPLGGNIPLYEKSKMPKPWDGIETPDLQSRRSKGEVWDYLWVTDLQERARRREIHDRIWKLSREAIAKQNVVSNIAAIAEYLNDSAMSDLATQALGEIGDPSAAQYLIPWVQKDIDAMSLDERYQSQHHLASWAPQALGSLDYTREPALYKKVESLFLAFSEVQKIAKYDVTTFLGIGLGLIGSTEIHNRIMRHETIPGLDPVRAIATWKDRAFIPWLYEAALTDEKEAEFGRNTKALGLFLTDIFSYGYNRSEMFANITKHILESHYRVNGDVLIALIKLRPEKCQ